MPSGTSRASGLVEFTVAGAVKKALPLVPVEDQDPAIGVIGDPHPNPAGPQGDLDGAGSRPRTLPVLSVRVQAEFLDRRLGDHGRLATPQ